MAIGVTLLGVLLLLYGGKLLVDSWATRNWPTTEGKVLEAKVAEVPGSEGGWMYRPQVRYAYTVGGRELNSERLFIADSGTLGWPGPSRRMVARYAPGTRCQVAYDPAKPHNAVLEPGVHWPVYTLIVTGIAFAALGLAIYFHIVTNS